MRSTLVIFLAISFFFVSCRKEKATWSSSWTAPLVKDTLRITDYVNDSTLGVNADQSIQVVLERDLVDFDISDLLVIPDTSIEQSFSIGVSNLNLSPGTTFIDDIQEHTFSLDGAALREARISSGKAEVTIFNPISEGGIFEVELPGVTKDGVTFTQSEFVEGGSNGNPNAKTFILDLSGYTIDMTGENGLSYNILQSKMTVTTDPNGSSVNVTDQDVFEFIVAFSGLKVEYGKGYFGQRVFSDTTVIDLEALNAIAGGNINIENVNFYIILYNGVKAPAQGVITQLISTNYNGDQVQLNHPDFNQTLNINPAQWDWVDLTFSERTLTFNQSTSNIIPFIENLGKEYKLGYEIELNPYGNASQGNNELFPQSSIGAKIKADFPLVLSSNQLKLRDTFDFSYEDKERFLEVEEGSFILSTNNSFPYGGSIQLRLLDENYNELAILEQSESVQPAPLNTSTDSHIVQSQETQIGISQEDVQVLKDVNHIELEVVFDSATNSNNVVYENAAIDFLLRANFKLRTNL
tara:strand:- start:15920 stop:17488 length:1569 start_codon:yes stop_codon:yes gene_type:complete